MIVETHEVATLLNKYLKQSPLSEFDRAILDLAKRVVGVRLMGGIPSITDRDIKNLKRFVK